MFYNLQNEIITKIYTYDSTYRDIYNKNMEYIKTFINRNILYDYNNDLKNIRSILKSLIT